MKKLLFVKLRILKYKLLSTCKRVIGMPKLHHPLLLNGLGTIQFGSNVQIGVITSPSFFTSYAYIEARNINSSVIIGNNVAINNNFSASSIESIEIRDNVLIGLNCSIIDNDGHDIDPKNRSKNTNSKSVIIDKNVFIGSNVTILKGVIIGENSIIGNGSVVTKDVPKNVVFGGNPAQFIREIHV